MLREMAIGDSYGAAFEFIKPARAEAVGLINDTKTYQHHPEFAIGGGRYTDDTQMALGIAELLCFGSYPHGLDIPALANKFVEVFKRDERLGYGSRFYELLKEVQTGDELRHRLEPTSTRSGGAMRAGPIGLYGSVSMVLAQASLQASLTHNTPQGKAAAQAIALMTHYFAYHDKPPVNLVAAYVTANMQSYQYPWSDDWSGWVTVEGLDSAHAAITCVKNGKSYRDVLERAINTTGDVDTVAAMAMFAVSLSDLENDLPIELYSGLEEGQYGRSYLEEVDRHLKIFARTQGCATL